MFQMYHGSLGPHLGSNHADFTRRLEARNGGNENLCIVYDRRTNGGRDCSWSAVRFRRLGSGFNPLAQEAVKR